MGHFIPNALQKMVTIAALVWFVAGGVGAVMALGVTTGGPWFVVSVDRTAKGDRLPTASTSKPHVNGASSVATNRTLPPLGCDSAFSRVAEPRQAHVFGRCAA